MIVVMIYKIKSQYYKYSNHQQLTWLFLIRCTRRLWARQAAICVLFTAALYIPSQRGSSMIVTWLHYPLTPTVAIRVQLQSILCQSGSSRHL